MSLRILLSTLLCLSFFGLGFAQDDGHHIRVKIDGFDESEIYLGYYLMDKQYLLDTTTIAEDGWFHFQGEEKIPSGMYLVVLPPDNRFFQLIINEEDQIFDCITTYSQNPSEGLKIKGSSDNQLFYDYINLISEKKPDAEKISQSLAEQEEGSPEAQKLQQQLDEVNQTIERAQQKIMIEHPETMTALIVKANQPLNYPDFAEAKDEQELQLKRWQYTKQHYFDNIPLDDERVLRTPFLFQRVDYYMNKLTVKHPDSLNNSLKTVLDAMKPAPENFKMYLVHYLNEYARSKVVGYDACYVYLVERYYATGDAYWTEEEQLEKILGEARAMSPLLIGKTAPNIRMETKEGKEMWLHDFQSPYTVLIFWDPECGHCKKSMPGLIEFYQEYKDKGVEIFAVCTRLYNELEKCWDFIDEKEMGIWLNVVDPYHRSKYKTVYNIKSTPQIYLLDEKKEILVKRIGVEQLPDILDQVMMENAEEKADR
jgi:thiol-disulfide isomerase/thioredoxin